MIFLLPERSGFAILKEDRIVEDNVMDEQSKGFRGVVFGGFKREDVLRYIEETDTRYFSETEELRRQLADCLLYTSPSPRD